MRNIYGRCKEYGKKNIVGRFLFSIIKLCKGRKGWETISYKLDDLDKSEEEQ
jgi:hypothetical protein